MQIDKTKPYYHTLTFQKGELGLPENSELAMFLGFSSHNSASEKYIKIKNALPRIKGLKSEKARTKFAYELVNNLNEK